MAKSKTKLVGFSRLATQAPDGTWRFHCRGVDWWFDDRAMGLNAGTVGECGILCPQLYFRSLAELGMFAEGFAVGRDHVK